VTSDDRRAQLRGNLEAVEARLTVACAAAGRRRDEVTLVAVTKTFPADDVRLLTDLGVHDIGENRDQEARAKAAALDDLDVRWHFVGRLQANKCRSVARYANVVHSVDSDRLVDGLANGAVAAGRRLDVFVQLSLDDDPHRSGARAADVPVLADRVAAAEHLRLVGVMAIAPLDADTTAAFARLADVAASVSERHPHATAISAGMSGDLEVAVAAGATHVRIGTALLGGRPPLVR
jgi:hypothetical protein